MRQFKSFLASEIKDFIYYRKASNNWCNSYEVNLSLFDTHCYKNYPNALELTQQMVDSWCDKRDTELNKSRNTRVLPIVQLIKYLSARDKIGVIEIVMLKVDNRTYIPHAFTEQELKNFFYACDTICPNPRGHQQRIRKITVPVFFRLLYSSGLRPPEARWLKVEDVDFEQGILSIRKTKGYDQHFVVLHDSMLELMKKYHEKISKLCPGRTYFFPSHNDKHHSGQWVSKTFKEMWLMYNEPCSVVPYDLRHHYAIVNINELIKEGFDFFDKLMYLSKSMGHSSIESTKYYYSLVPALANILKELNEDEFNNIIPEVEEDEEE